MNRKTAYILWTALTAVLTTGCSTTKRLGDGEVLYTGVKKIRIESVDGEKVPGYVKDAVKSPLSVKPNNPLYTPYWRTPIPTGLWVWNNWYSEEEKGFKHWVYKRLAKEPVLISDVKPDIRMKMVKDILDNLGYFGSAAGYEILPGRNPEKAKLTYRITVNEPWFYGGITYPDSICPVTGRICDLRETSLIKSGEQYNIDTLTDERVRITNHLRRNSFYYFRPDFIEYLADTTRERHTVDLRMVMAKGIPPEAMRPYNIGDVNISLLSSETGGEPDSMTYNGINIYYEKPLRLRPKVLTRALVLKPGVPSDIDHINATITNLNKLGVFRYVNIGVTPIDSLRGADAIDLDIAAAFDQPLEAELEANVSSKSNSFIGPGLIFSVKHKNIFKGGEVLAVKVNGAYEWQTGNTSSAANATAVNSYEVGISSSLMFPRLLIPRFMRRPLKYDSRTTFNLGATLLNRPNFFRMLSANASAAYDFQSSPTSFHNVVPLKLTYNKLLSRTDSFEEAIEGKRALAMSFEDQFVPALSYTYTFNKKTGRARENNFILQSTVISSGNILGGIYSLAGAGSTKRLFGLPFAQFIKGVTELKYYHRVGYKNTLAMRVSLGAGHAYGNFDVMPYTEQFYIGGANSIRAFTIRSLGPGSFRPDAEDEYGYFDQTGDFKFEANIEFRFGIIGGLQGALFLDAGNIWLLNEDTDRPGGKLKMKNFFRELATGTGVGLRYDLTFLILRADLGIGIHTPYGNPDRTGYYNIGKFRNGLGFHFAIGYPF